MAQKIFIDCSYLYEHPELNTGIQRVVRKVLDNLEKIAPEENLEIIPVVISHANFQQISKESLYSKKEPTQKTQSSQTSLTIKSYLKNLYKAFRDLLSALLPIPIVKNFLYAPKDRFGLRYIVEKLFIKPYKSITLKKESSKPTSSAPAVNRGDILLLIDSTWYLNIWPTVSNLKKDGVRVVSVIYDLIPITHPQFCDDFLAEVFRKWFYDSLKYIDKFITISHTVEKDLKKFLKSQFDAPIEDKRFDHFLLGSDFNYKQSQNQNIRDDIKKLYSNNENIYLTVSTIEPRKNHSYLLDAFELLWQNGSEATLLIVGRVGWKVEETMHRINTHPELHKKLFIYTDLNDVELKFCYENSKMLLFASIVEGFGLPIVESLTHHLPVLASDTPIHKEVGADMIGYFDLSNPQDLAKKIEEIQKNGIPKKLIPPKNYSWLTWEDSTRDLLRKACDG